jgi:hypothetical protein
MRRYFLLLLLLGMLPVSPVLGQSRDWLPLLHQLLSKDEGTKAAAQQQLFDTVIPKMLHEEPDQLTNDLVSLMRASQQDESVRLEASGVLAAIQPGFPNSVVAFKAVIPAIVEQFHEPIDRVRRNAVFFILNLRPEIPKELAQPLADMLTDADAQSTRAAILGLARLCRATPIAVEQLRKLVDSEPRQRERLLAIQAIGWAKCAQPELLASLGRALGDKDSEIAAAALETVGQLGPAATPLKTELRRIALTSTDPTLADGAEAILARLP